METVLVKIKVEKYSSYKNSGSEWLGDIPIHWNTLSNKNIFKLKKNQVGKKSGDYVLLSLTLNGVIKRDMENPQGKFPAEFNTYQEVKKGDFIFCLFDVEETPRCVGLSDFDGMITGAYTVMEPNDNFDRNFLYYFYLNLDTDKRLKPLYTGLRKTISKEKFFSFKTFVPPLPEQTAIAAFLDSKAALIDQAIDIKQKQIELLKERRQILIHKAVTRGLNPNVKMKNSGVEWIGEIPEGWVVRRIKTLTRVKRGASPRPIDDPRYFNDNGDFAWVRIADVSSNDHYLINTVQKLSKLGSSLSVKILPNELFISIAGTVGKPMISKIKCCIHDGFVYFPDLKMNLEYMYRIFETGQPYLGLGKYGTQLNLNTETIGNIYIPFPTSNTQNEIVFEVDNISIKFTNAISLKEQEIEKLKEYKATLINSAVTGKIKVYDDAK
jgi:type I restriction enzyme S subunit